MDRIFSCSMVLLQALHLVFHAALSVSLEKLCMLFVLILMCRLAVKNR